MGNTKGIVVSIAAMVTALGLVGCGQTPGEAEVREALTKQIVAVSGKDGEQTAKEELAKLKVIGCAKAEPNGFKCDWTSPSGSGSGRIVKSDSGWVLVGG